MLKTTVGQVLVNEALPPEHRNFERVMIGPELDDLLAEIGRKSPGKYREVTHKLVQLGREAAFREGTTLSLDDLKPPAKFRQEVFDHVRAQQERIVGDAQMSPAEKQEAITGVYQMAQKLLVDKTYDLALKAKNPLALQILSKARGNPAQLAALMVSPSTFSDAKGNTIPIFVEHSYAEGLKPWEYYAATFGARKGVLSTKFAVRDAGDLGKQMNNVSAGLMITENDCGSTNGIPVNIDDADNLGAVLARTTGGIPLGTPLTSKNLKALKESGAKTLLVRSPVTCQTKNGLCKQCAGLREDGRLPSLRDAIGLKAASALAERIAQGALNEKHRAAAGGGEKSKEQVYAGFDIINQLGQVPSAFRHAAALAAIDGPVTKIEPAPQGGTNIYIGEEVHYVEPEQTATVKIGDELEAGDQMSTGLVNPAEVVRYKGVGEGRRYFAERLAQAYRDSGLKVNRRNTEVLSRALIDHVLIDDPDGLGDYLPGDVASYSALAYSYHPRSDSRVVKPDEAIGKYLEQPVLQHTIGARVTKRMLDELKQFDVSKINVHDEPPAFTPQMRRMRTAAQYGKDWLAKLHGTYLKSNLLSDVQGGAESNIHGTHPVPAIAYGVELGESRPGQVTY